MLGYLELGHGFNLEVWEIPLVLKGSNLESARSVRSQEEVALIVLFFNPSYPPDNHDISIVILYN